VSESVSEWGVPERTEIELRTELVQLALRWRDAEQALGLHAVGARSNGCYAQLDDLWNAIESILLLEQRRERCSKYFHGAEPRQLSLDAIQPLVLALDRLGDEGVTL